MFGIALSVRSRVRECTPGLFRQMVDAPQTGRTCAEIQDLWEAWKRGELTKEEFEEKKSELKRRLPIITPHAMFPKGVRKNEEAVPSGLSMYDIDHIENPRGYYEEKVSGRERALGIVLAHVTPSTEGLRLVFRMPAGMSLAEAQKWMSERLGDATYDGCVKDLARCSFLVPRDYILHLDEGLFEENGNEGGVDSKSKIQNSINESEKQLKQSEQPIPPLQGRQEETSVAASLMFKGIPYSEIIEEYWGLTGGVPSEGERNKRLHQLAVNLRAICDNREEWLLAVMPTCGLSAEEMRSIVHSACKEPTKGSRVMDKIVDKIKRRMSDEAGGETDSPLDKMPEMPKRLPKLVALLTSRTPDLYKAAVAHAVFPPLAAHLHQTRFRYIDNVEHEATLMNVLMAGTGAGKDCITAPINHIMADIRRRDAENLRREREWKDEVNRRGANKDKRQRPEGLVIQEIDADMTGPAFVMRMAEADGHFLYTKLNEIDQFDALRGNGRGGQQFQIMCLAFDPDNRYGQTRVGTQSVTEKVTVRFNWNATTTIKKGQRYFERVLTDGPISRINFCTIPEREIGAPMPVYGTYDAAFDEELRPYIERLCTARGVVDCPQAFKLAKKLQQECADFSRLSQSRTYENLSFRALVIAYLKACVLYVANDNQWDKQIEDFIRWSLHYDLWCKMHFFGPAIERANSEISFSNGPRPRNLLELLPNEFTLQDAIRVRREQGLSSEGAQDMIRTWRNRKYIVSPPEGEQRTNEQCSMYVKLKFRN